MYVCMYILSLKYMPQTKCIPRSHIKHKLSLKLFFILGRKI